MTGGQIRHVDIVADTTVVAGVMVIAEYRLPLLSQLGLGLPDSFQSR
jgi:hypothetical protein